MSTRTRTYVHLRTRAPANANGWLRVHQCAYTSRNTSASPPISRRTRQPRTQRAHLNQAALSTAPAKHGPKHARTHVQTHRRKQRKRRVKASVELSSHSCRTPAAPHHQSRKLGGLPPSPAASSIPVPHPPRTRPCGATPAQGFAAGASRRAGFPGLGAWVGGPSCISLAHERYACAARDICAVTRICTCCGWYY